MAYTNEEFSRWIEKSDIDYTTYYIKAWLPFNAWWYNQKYKDDANLNTDRAIINELKRTSNSIRNSIEYFMEGSGQDSVEFKNYLAALHHHLQSERLENNGERISFCTIVKEKNPDNVIQKSYKRSQFYLRRNDGNRLGNVNNMVITVRNSNRTDLFNQTINDYNFDLIRSNTSFQSLSATRQEGIKLFFDELIPFYTIDLIENAPSAVNQPQNHYKCDNYNFKRDLADAYCHAHLVCKGLIEVLYSLRNILFHAELNPTEIIQPIYQNAYFLLKMLLGRIR